jgi:hypothetical protein
MTALGFRLCGHRQDIREIKSPPLLAKNPPESRQTKTFQAFCLVLGREAIERDFFSARNSKLPFLGDDRVWEQVFGESHRLERNL